MRIRHARKKDVGEILGLMEENYRLNKRFYKRGEIKTFGHVKRHYGDLIKNNIESKSGLVVVALNTKDAIVGFIIAHMQNSHFVYKDEKTLNLMYLYVKRTYRSRGTGSELMRSALEWGKGKGADRAYLMTHSKNKGAMRLYRRLGFTDYFTGMMKT